MTPSITENQGTVNNSGIHSQSSFALSDEELENAPQFLEESKKNNLKNLKTFTKFNNERSSSMREVRRQLKLSLEKTKQFFNSVTQKNETPEITNKNDKKMTRKESNISRNSLSRVEYRNFRKHEFFEEKLKMQRQKVRFMVEEDPESDRKVNFKNNLSFIKVMLTAVYHRNCKTSTNQHSNFIMEKE